MGISGSLLFLFCLLCVDSLLQLQIQCFSLEEEETNTVYQRDAVASAGAVELINNSTSLSHVGEAMYADQAMQIRDSCNRKLSCFSTRCNHANDTQLRPNHGSGLALIFSPVVFQIPRNSADGFLGLHNTSNRDSFEYQVFDADSCPLTNRKRLPLYEHVQNNKNSTSSSFNTTNFSVLVHCSDSLNTFPSWIRSSTSSINNTSTLTKRSKVRLTLSTSSAVTIAVLLSLAILLTIVCVIVSYKRRRWAAKKAA